MTDSATAAADTTTAVADVPVAKPDHVVVINGRDHMYDAKGHLVPVELIETVELLEDETVRKIVRFAKDLQAQLRRFKDHTQDDIAGLRAVVAQEHNVSMGGAKGNLTLHAYDRLSKVSLKIADLTFFDDSLQLAKAKVTECIRQWSGGAQAELVALAEAAFRVDQEGRVNRNDLLFLTRLRVENNPLWDEAMELIRKAERPLGSKEYVHIHVRDTIKDKWTHVAIDLAAV